MSALRELIANDLARGDMSESASEETSLDRIGALARADPLGAALWRVTGNLDAAALVKAKGLLILRLCNGCEAVPPLVARIAQLALEEWLAHQCEACGGRKVIIDPVTKTRSKCQACDGSGRGRHSDVKRMTALGISSTLYASAAADYFAHAHRFLNEADARVERQIAYQLGKPLKGKA